jgi:hypothetical protein
MRYFAERFSSFRDRLRNRPVSNLESAIVMAIILAALFYGMTPFPL